MVQAKATVKNATYLFELPARSYRSSESWWTALFSMFVLHLANDADGRTIPLKRYQRAAQYWQYVPAIEPQLKELPCRGLTLANVLMEARLTDAVFGTPWPQQFVDLRPDLTILRSVERQVILIENKTIGASIGAQLDTYVAAVDYLRQQGWDAHAVLLIKSG